MARFLYDSVGVSWSSLAKRLVNFLPLFWFLLMKILMNQHTKWSFLLDFGISFRLCLILFSFELGLRSTVVAWDQVLSFWISSKSPLLEALVIVFDRAIGEPSWLDISSLVGLRLVLFYVALILEKDLAYSNCLDQTCFILIGELSLFQWTLLWSSCWDFVRLSLVGRSFYLSIEL